jgi:FkbM family methyltransferase
VDAIVRLFGREWAWRISRRIYMAARGESANAIETNGERALLAAALRGAQTRSNNRPFTVFDVGANVGAYSRAVIAEADCVGMSLDLTAFEPAPQTFATLCASLAERPGLRMENLALSAAPGEAHMQILGANAGTNTLSPGDDAGEFVLVKLDTLSGYASARGIAALDLIKIDAEGHDFDVLKGGLGLFQQGRVGICQFEYNHRWLFAGASLHLVFRLLHGLPYCIGRVGPSGVEVFNAWNPELDRFFEGNYALLREDLLVHTPHRLLRVDESNVYVSE